MEDRIKVIIGGRTYTMEEARKLYEELKEIFEKDNSYSSRSLENDGFIIY